MKNSKIIINLKTFPNFEPKPFIKSKFLSIKQRNLNDYILLEKNIIQQDEKLTSEIHKNNNFISVNTAREIYNNNHKTLQLKEENGFVPREQLLFQNFHRNVKNYKNYEYALKHIFLKEIWKNSEFMFLPMEILEDFNFILKEFLLNEVLTESNQNVHFLSFTDSFFENNNKNNNFFWLNAKKKVILHDHNPKKSIQSCLWESIAENISPTTLKNNNNNEKNENKVENKIEMTLQSIYEKENHLEKYNSNNFNDYIHFLENKYVSSIWEIANELSFIKEDFSNNENENEKNAEIRKLFMLFTVNTKNEKKDSSLLPLKNILEFYFLLLQTIINTKNQSKLFLFQQNFESLFFISENNNNKIVNEAAWLGYLHDENYKKGKLLLNEFIHQCFTLLFYGRSEYYTEKSLVSVLDCLNIINYNKQNENKNNSVICFVKGTLKNLYGIDNNNKTENWIDWRHFYEFSFPFLQNNNNNNNFSEAFRYFTFTVPHYYSNNSELIHNNNNNNLVLNSKKVFHQSLLLLFSENNNNSGLEDSISKNLQLLKKELTQNIKIKNNNNNFNNSELFSPVDTFLQSLLHILGTALSLWILKHENNNNNNNEMKNNNFLEFASECLSSFVSENFQDNNSENNNNIILSPAAIVSLVGLLQSLSLSSSLPPVIHTYIKQQQHHKNNENLENNNNNIHVGTVYGYVLRELCRGEQWTLAEELFDFLIQNKNNNKNSENSNNNNNNNNNNEILLFSGATVDKSIYQEIYDWSVLRGKMEWTVKLRQYRERLFF